MNTRRSARINPAVARAGLWALVGGLMVACAQAPPNLPSPAPAPLPSDVEPASPRPRLRGINPADLPREEPGVGVGGLTHEAEQPAQ